MASSPDREWPHCVTVDIWTDLGRLLRSRTRSRTSNPIGASLPFPKPAGQHSRALAGPMRRDCDGFCDGSPQTVHGDCSIASQLPSPLAARRLARRPAGDPARGGGRDPAADTVVDHRLGAGVVVGSNLGRALRSSPAPAAPRAGHRATSQAAGRSVVTTRVDEHRRRGSRVCDGPRRVPAASGAGRLRVHGMRSLQHLADAPFGSTSARRSPLAG